MSYFPEEKIRAVFLLADIEVIKLEEIDNEYCSPTCCPENNWWLVTTDIGIIKVGWRKRVINLDWSLVPDAPTGYEFQDEVTKWATGIHAYGYGKLVQYLVDLKVGVRNIWLEKSRKSGVI